MLSKILYIIAMAVAFIVFLINDHLFSVENTNYRCKDMQEDYEYIKDMLETEEILLRNILQQKDGWGKDVKNASLGIWLLNTEFALAPLEKKKSDIYKSLMILFQINGVTLESIIPHQPDCIQIRTSRCVQWSLKMEAFIESCHLSSKDLEWDQFEKYLVLHDYHYDESIQYFKWTHEVSVFGLSKDIKKHIDNVFLSLPLLISQGTPTNNIQGFVMQVFVHYSLNVIDNYFQIEGLSMRACHHLDLHYFYKDVLRYS